MTCIVYRAGVLAGDTQATQGELCSFGPKIWTNGTIAIGSGGDFVAASKFETWVKKTHPSWLWDFTKKRPSFTDDDAFISLILHKTGIYEVNQTMIPCKNPAEYYAIGTGAEVAMGALFAGASARSAVYAAIHHSLHTGGKVTSATIEMDK